LFFKREVEEEYSIESAEFIEQK